ncbi:sensor histidine kinase [Sneathiella glossodoripedis]|uniref:sensor histidine kinase n=1 Tax=Sneathiella glossodoripedis TaxID=418853 RepID=UPI000471BF6B|nr:HAMP domain-containing sensor histidine kinase [Sneathiella glossodoripedis]
MSYFGKVAKGFRSLSARLLLLTVLFVMLAEILIFVPSIAFFRENYLVKKAEFAHLASLALLASPDLMVSKELKEELLFRVGARSIVFRSANSSMLMLSEDMPVSVDASYDLSQKSAFILIEDALVTLMNSENRIIRVTSPIENSPTSSLEMVIDESPLRVEMLEYSWNIFRLSLVISLLTAFLVYLSLHWLMVRPMGRLSASMIAFRRSPENVASGIVPSGRTDEIGAAERELEIMQTRLRFALKQKDHLAALGVAVTKISHDLRNILSTSHLVSDSLAKIDDPMVQKIVPRLVGSIDRAIELCNHTLRFGRAEEHSPRRERFLLLLLINEVKATVLQTDAEDIDWVNDFDDDFDVFADREHMYRILMNICRNSIEALSGQHGKIKISAVNTETETVIRVVDTGPGIPPRAREHLFEPFAGSVKTGGTGLGLSIARELVIAHGGEIEVEFTGETGTCFRILLPN